MKRYGNILWVAVKLVGRRGGNADGKSTLAATILDLPKDERKSAVETAKTGFPSHFRLEWNG